ncbi:hypothetical protein MMC18_003831 [Xylographa bjoerkii]|nr:hypothetical protein [Xylographa bjoerkii]
MPEDRASEVCWKVWTLEDAIADETQRAIMKRDLDPADWSFFSPAHGSRGQSMARDITVKRVEEGDGWKAEALAARVEEQQGEDGDHRVDSLGYEVMTGIGSCEGESAYSMVSVSPDSACSVFVPFPAS